MKIKKSKEVVSDMVFHTSTSESANGCIVNGFHLSTCGKEAEIAVANALAQQQQNTPQHVTSFVPIIYEVDLNDSIGLKGYFVYMNLPSSDTPWSLAILGNLPVGISYVDLFNDLFQAYVIHSHAEASFGQEALYDFVSNATPPANITLSFFDLSMVPLKEFTWYQIIYPSPGIMQSNDFHLPPLHHACSWLLVPQEFSVSEGIPLPIYPYNTYPFMTPSVALRLRAHSSIFPNDVYYPDTVGFSYVPLALNPDVMAYEYQQQQGHQQE